MNSVRETGNIFYSNIFKFDLISGRAIPNIFIATFNSQLKIK